MTRENRSKTKDMDTELTVSDEGLAKARAMQVTKQNVGMLVMVEVIHQAPGITKSNAAQLCGVMDRQCDGDTFAVLEALRTGVIKVTPEGAIQ